LHGSSRRGRKIRGDRSPHNGRPQLGRLIRMRTNRHGCPCGHQRQHKGSCKRVVGASQSVTRFIQHWDFDTLSDCGFSNVFESCSEPVPASPSGRAFCPQNFGSSNHKMQIRDTASCNPQKSRVSLHHPYTEYTIYIRLRDREIGPSRAHFDISCVKFRFATLFAQSISRTFVNAACAAARRAIGTRNGEHET
jgi:hypothetical protein